MTPSYDLSETKTRTKWDEKDSSKTVTSQLWQESGSCPKGTIPVRRIRKNDLLKAYSVEHYGRKKPSFSHQVAQSSDNQNSNFQQMNHSVSLTLHSFFELKVFSTRYIFIELKSVCNKVCVITFYHCSSTFLTQHIMWIRKQYWLQKVIATQELKGISKFGILTLRLTMSTVLLKFVFPLALTIILKALNLDGR